MQKISLIDMTETTPRLDLSNLTDGFLREGTDGLRSAIVFRRISFGVPLHDAVALDGGIHADGSLDAEKLALYEELEARLMAHRGEAAAVVGAFALTEDPQDTIRAMSVSVGVLNPEANHIIKPRAQTLGAEIDTSGRHAEVWHYFDHTGKAGIQWADLRDHGIPTVMPNDFHQIGENVLTDNGNTVTTHVLAGSEITDWIEARFMSNGSKGSLMMAHQLLASTVQCIYMQYGAEAVNGLFMDYWPFENSAKLELAMVRDVYNLCLAYEDGLTFGGEPISGEESLLLNAGLTAVVNRRVEKLAELHRDLLWRLPRTAHGPVLSEYGVPYADSNQERIKVIKPHYEAFRALLSDRTS